MAAELSAVCGRGYLLRDKHFTRAFVAAPQHSLIRKLLWTSTASQRCLLMLQILLVSECTDFLLVLPEYRSLYDTIKSEYEQLCTQLQLIIDSLDFTDRYYLSFIDTLDISDRYTIDCPLTSAELFYRKKFAAGAAKYSWKQFLFEMFDMQCVSVKQYLQQLTSGELLQTLKYLHSKKLLSQLNTLSTALIESHTIKHKHHHGDGDDT
jgi:hypothetical protein